MTDTINTDTINRDASLSGQAAGLLRRRILEGVYLPGERLVEVDLASAMDISRAPLREALFGLVQEGLVVHKTNKGFYVPTITIHDARALYEFREAIETAAARWAATRATPEELQEMAERLNATQVIISKGDEVPYPRELDFHWSVVRAAHSALLEQRARETNQQLQLMRQRSAYDHHRACAAYAEHVTVANTIAAGNPDKAEEAMRRHQQTLREYALTLIAKSLSAPYPLPEEAVRTAQVGNDSDGDRSG